METSSRFVEDCHEELRKTRPWLALFLSLSGLAALSLAALAFFSLYQWQQRTTGSLTWNSGALFSILLPLVYSGMICRLCFLIGQFIRAIGTLDQERNVTELESVFRSQGRFWKYSGILFLSGIGILLALFFVSVGAG